MSQAMRDNVFDLFLVDYQLVDLHNNLRFLWQRENENQILL